MPVRIAAIWVALTLAPAWAQEAAPDRIVAEWMLRMGGSVILEGQRRPITDLADLPTSDFRIHTLNFTGITQWGFALEDELKRLPPLAHLKELYVNGRLWYDQPISLVASTMRLFAGATNLEKLILTKPVQTYIPWDDSVLKELAPLTRLQELRVQQTRIAGSLSSSFKLKYLDLNYDRTFNDQGMNSLRSMTELTKLYLRGTSITDLGLKNLADLIKLTELDLADTGITDTGLANLAGSDETPPPEPADCQCQRCRSRSATRHDRARRVESLPYPGLQRRPGPPGRSEEVAGARSALQPRHRCRHT